MKTPGKFTIANLPIPKLRFSSVLILEGVEGRIENAGNSKFDCVFGGTLLQLITSVLKTKIIMPKLSQTLLWTKIRDKSYYSARPIYSRDKKSQYLSAKFIHYRWLVISIYLIINMMFFCSKENFD